MEFVEWFEEHSPHTEIYVWSPLSMTHDQQCEIQTKLDKISMYMQQIEKAE